MRCSSHVTPDGGLQVQLDLRPEDLAGLGQVLQQLQGQVHRGLQLQLALERNQALEAIEYEQRLDAFLVQARLALSVYRRTRSWKLASQASGIQRTDVRLLVAEANARQKACHVQARQDLVGRLHAAKVPVREIARRTGYHIKSVPRIARAARQAQLPGLGGALVPGTA